MPVSIFNENPHLIYKRSTAKQTNSYNLISARFLNGHRHEAMSPIAQVGNGTFSFSNSRYSILLFIRCAECCQFERLNESFKHIWMGNDTDWRYRVFVTVIVSVAMTNPIVIKMKVNPLWRDASLLSIDVNGTRHDSTWWSHHFLVFFVLAY